MTKPVKTKVYEPKTYNTPSDLNIKKPEVNPQKIEDYKDILVAVGFSASEAKQKAKSLLKKVGLENRLNHSPKELSGGEQQRVAVARSLINDPKLILADEPTGSLDEKNAELIIEMLVDIKNRDSLIIFATHNKVLVNKSDLELTIKDRTVNFN